MIHIFVIIIHIQCRLNIGRLMTPMKMIHFFVMNICVDMPSLF